MDNPDLASAAFVLGVRIIARHSPKLRDPRFYLIAVLGLLLCYGIVILDFGVRWRCA